MFRHYEVLKYEKLVLRIVTIILAAIMAASVI